MQLEPYILFHGTGLFGQLTDRFGIQWMVSANE